MNGGGKGSAEHSCETMRGKGTTWTNFVAGNILMFLSFFFLVAQQPPVGQGLLIHEVSRPHNEAPQSVGLLWTSDQLVAETST